MQLLARAFTDWNEDAFTDEEVEQVKTIFQGVFGTQSLLQGFTIDDALVMRAPDDSSILYCMVVRPPPDAPQWVRLDFRVRNFEFMGLPRFELLCMVAAEYNESCDLPP